MNGDFLHDDEIKELQSAFAMENESTDKNNYSIPEYWTNEHITTFYNLHDHLARVFSISLSAFLRTIVEVRVASINQCTYHDFIHSVPNPTYISVINADPLEGKLLIESSPLFNFPVLDRLSGGRGTLYNQNRELTEIEQSILEKVLYRLFDCMHEAWASIIPLNLSLEQSEANPQILYQLYIPTESMLIITLEIIFGEIQGFITVSYPYPTLKVIESDIIPGYCYTPFYRHYVMFQNVSPRLNDVKLPIHTKIGSSEIHLQDMKWETIAESVSQPKTEDNEAIVCIGNDCRTFIEDKINSSDND